MARLLFSLIVVLRLGGQLSGQTAPDSGASPPPAGTAWAPSSSVEDGRAVSWTKLVPNIGSDQKRIWLFPAHLIHGKNWLPVVGVLGATGALIATDAYTARYFRRIDSFRGFNSVFAANNASLAIVAAPVSLYAVSYFSKSPHGQNTALLAAEAVADSEIVATIMKYADRRARPADLSPNANFGDTWTDSKGGWLRGNGSFPSGHAIAAFSVAAVISGRYRNHRWVPYVAYGLAAAIGFSRITLSAHFPSDVFMGAVLGYSIGRFAVLRQ